MLTHWKAFAARRQDRTNSSRTTLQVERRSRLSSVGSGGRRCGGPCDTRAGCWPCASLDSEAGDGTLRAASTRTRSWRGNRGRTKHVAQSDVSRLSVKSLHCRVDRRALPPQPIARVTVRGLRSRSAASRACSACHTVQCWRGRMSFRCRSRPRKLRRNGQAQVIPGAWQLTEVIWEADHIGVSPPATCRSPGRIPAARGAPACASPRYARAEQPRRGGRHARSPATRRPQFTAARKSAGERCLVARATIPYTNTPRKITTPTGKVINQSATSTRCETPRPPFLSSGRSRGGTFTGRTPACSEPSERQRIFRSGARRARAKGAFGHDRAPSFCRSCPRAQRARRVREVGMSGDEVREVIACASRIQWLRASNRPHKPSGPRQPGASREAIALCVPSPLGVGTRFTRSSRPYTRAVMASGLARPPRLPSSWCARSVDVGVEMSRRAGRGATPRATRPTRVARDRPRPPSPPSTRRIDVTGDSEAFGRP